MTGEHRHRNDTTNGQRVSRQSLPTLLCFNFSQRTKILKFYADPQTAHLQAAQANAQPKLAKEPFFAIAQTEILTLNDTLKNK
ncbi:MAG TPA: hypothetical protein PKC10_00020 [Cyclobacteriaceae bacterium]|nr:hypothetical protein [Cyclobacteriaceae bacterium]